MENDDLRSLGLKIQRLKKRIDKLTKQRDYHQKMHEHYAKVISMQPYIERRWKTYEEMKSEIERVRGLEQRVKEQALLIKELTKNEHNPTKPV